jgi:hypothetical protein
VLGCRRTPMFRLRIAAIALGVLALGLAGCSSTPTSSASNSGGQPSAPTQAPTSTPNPLILAPAITPSSVGICSQQMSFGADGNASPIVCSNGAINVVAWTYFEVNAPALFAAGADASEGQVAGFVQQLQGPIPSNESGYCLAAAYYGGPLPSTSIRPARSCPPNRARPTSSTGRDAG